MTLRADVINIRSQSRCQIVQNLDAHRIDAMQLNSDTTDVDGADELPTIYNTLEMRCLRVDTISVTDTIST